MSAVTPASYLTVARACAAGIHRRPRIAAGAAACAAPAITLATAAALTVVAKPMPASPANWPDAALAKVPAVSAIWPVLSRRRFVVAQLSKSRAWQCRRHRSFLFEIGDTDMRCAGGAVRSSLPQWVPQSERLVRLAFGGVVVVICAGGGVGNIVPLTHPYTAGGAVLHHDGFRAALDHSPLPGGLNGV
jgi:hypothetical protein